MNNEKEMYQFNLGRTMKASAFINQLSDEVYDALFDFYEDIDQDLNSINVDNDIINGLNFMSLEEFNNENNKDDYVILYQDESEVVFWN